MTPTTLLPITDLDTYVATRDALHRVAEHVLAPVRYADDRGIRLTAHPGGFGTPPLSDGRRVRVDGTTIVIDALDGAKTAELDTIGSAAAFVGVEPGLPSGLYQPATTFVADAPLLLDAQCAAVLAAWYALTAGAIERFAAEVADASPSAVVLWPEHFDQAISTEDADERARANYGASPGDEGHPEPYVYVGPWSPVDPADPFWNATHFNGAVLPMSALVSSANPADDVLAFLRSGRQKLTNRP